MCHFYLGTGVLCCLRTFRAMLAVLYQQVALLQETGLGTHELVSVQCTSGQS